jgi:hypothetical protein
LLIDKVKQEGLPYGYMVKSMLPAAEAVEPDELDVRSLVMSQMQSNPSAINLTKPAMILRIFPDGREEPVRGASFGSISLNSLRELSASSEGDFIYDFRTAPGGMPGAAGLLTLLLGSAGMPAMDYPATVITPAFILQGIDIKKPTRDYRKPPIVDTREGDPGTIVCGILHSLEVSLQRTTDIVNQPDFRSQGGGCAARSLR